MAHEQPQPRACVVCGQPAIGRSRYCGGACRQRASRLGRQPDQQALLTALSQQLGERQQLLRHTVYQCSSCDQRFLGERRCPECNLMLKKLGVGGPCPGCDELVLISELLEG